MTLKDLKKLKEKLPDKWAEKIADKTGVSPDMVRRVLRNNRKNQYVIDAAIELAQEHQAEEKKKVETINSI